MVYTRSINGMGLFERRELMSRRRLSLFFTLLVTISIIPSVYAASEDGTWYDTAFTIIDVYNIPVVNCDGDEGLVYKFTAPATAAYTIISVCNYDKTIQIENESCMVSKI